MSKDKSPAPEQPQLPTTSEIVKPMGRLLDGLDKMLDRSNVPQVAALREVFLSRDTGAARDLAYDIWTTFNEKRFGPYPKYNGGSHPQREEWEDLIDRIKSMVLAPSDDSIGGDYILIRKAMLADAQIAPRVPATIRASPTLTAFRTIIEETVRDALDSKAATETFLMDEFRPLHNWLSGSPPYGSPEWIAQETYFLRDQIEVAWVAMTRLYSIRKVIEGDGIERVRQDRWTRFIERELDGAHETVGALEIAWATLTHARRVADKIVQESTTSIPIVKDPSVQRRKPNRARK